MVLIFLCTALLRSVATKQALVDAGQLKPEDMTQEERSMPGMLSLLMVGVGAGLPLGVLCYTKCHKRFEDDDGDEDGEDGDDEDGDGGGGRGVAGFSLNPMRDGEPQEGSQAAGRVRQNET